MYLRLTPSRSNALLAAIVAVGVSLFAGQATARAQDVSGIVTPLGAPSTGAPPSTRPSTQQSMDETYAAREANAKDLASFKGGRVVYIASGTVVVILLVVLILILL